MDIRKLQRAIVDGLEDVKAHNIVVFNTEHLSPLFERVIVASGTSNRQTRALASSVRETVKARGLPILSVEGADNGEWIIVDCGAAVAHIMQPAIRDYYRLEEIWGDKPVKMKLDGDPRLGVVQAAPAKAATTPASQRAVASTPARKPAATKAAPKRPAAKKSAAKKSAAKQPVRKAAAAKKAPPRRPALPRRAR